MLIGSGAGAGASVTVLVSVEQPVSDASEASAASEATETRWTRARRDMRGSFVRFRGVSQQPRCHTKPEKTRSFGALLSRLTRIQHAIPRRPPPLRTRNERRWWVQR